MKKTVRYVDADTLEIKETSYEAEIDEDEILDEYANMLREALGCEPEDFYEKYKKYKDAEAEFKTIYEPFKEKLIQIHSNKSNLPKTLIIGGAKVTYVSPSIRTTVDTKKLKEEEPDIAKKYTKSTNVNATVRLEGV